MKKVKQYVEGCNQCQRMKDRTEMLAGKLRPNKVLEKLWQYISVDFIMKLPVSKSHDSILVIYNRFLKILHFVAIIEKMIVEELAKLFRDNIQKLHGLSKSVILDRRPQFVARLMKELNKMLEIEVKLSMAYHPQTNGQIERTNQKLEQYLRMYIDHRQSNWSEQLTTAEFTFNNKIHISTKSSLFKVNYEREPRMSFDIRKKEKNVKVKEFVKKIKNRHEKVKVALIKSQKEMKRQVNRNRKEIEKYRVEDKMLISTKDFLMELMKRVIRKLTEKYIGPYIVKKIISENVMELELLMSLRIHLVVDIRRIMKYREQVEGQKKIPPPLVEIEEEKEYEIEKISDRQEKREKLKYLVRWKGYIAEEDTWKELENPKNMRGLVEKFKKEIRKEEIQQIEKEKEKQRIVKVELNPEAEEFKRSKLLGKYIARILFGWDNKKFENKYLKKLERNQAR